MASPSLAARAAILGVPYQPNKRPDPLGVVKAFEALDAKAMATSAGAIVRETLIDLNAVTSPPAHQMGWVTGDATMANNGIYENAGSPSAPNWQRRADLPHGTIHMINVGAGTPDAIVATSSLPAPVAPGAALFTVNIVAANTGPVTINGKPLLTNSGNQIVPGGLTAPLIPVFVDLGDHFRLLSDQASAAIVSLASTAAERAETALDEIEALFAGGYTASTVPVATAGVIKSLNTTTFPVAWRNDVGKEGFCQWDASIPANRARADKDELTYISPDLDSAGAYKRVNLSAKERGAINRALNERPFEAPPAVLDHFNALVVTPPYLGRQVNLTSTSEDLTDTHWVKDTLSLVSGDTMTWQGVQLQRVTGITGFTSRIRDLRAADYPLTTGRRYIMSAVICAPFVEADNYGVPGPWNRFIWMNSAANIASWGSGAKLIGPTPRRVWCIFEADGNNYRTVGGGDPAVPLSSQPSDGGSCVPFVHLYGLGASLPGADIYIGGMQIEEAPNQTEKQGIVTVGTSIDVGGGGGGKGEMRTPGRGWPRWLEGLLSVPIFCGSVGGQTSAQILARFTDDIVPIAENAKYCVLCCNVNDFSSGFNSATYRQNWQDMRDLALAAGMKVVMMTPQRLSNYGYADGAADMEAEIAYIKATYPFVIDRDEVMQDCFNANLLNQVYDTDDIHQSIEGSRAFAFMLYHKYRHFFPFDNVPGPYQKTLLDNSKVQSFGGPIWSARVSAVRVASTSATAVRDTQEGTAPLIILEATTSGNIVYQLPCANFDRESERVNTDVQVQMVRNATTGGHDIYVRYYKRVSGTLTAINPSFGPIPAGETWTVATDGDSAWRVQ